MRSLAIAFMGIFASLAQPFAARADDVVQVVTPSVLNSAPEHWDGRQVIVRGYFVLAPESRVLYESAELHEEMQRSFKSGTFDPRKYDKYCLTLSNARLIDDNREVFNGQTAQIKGTFRAHYLNDHFIDLQACALPTALEIDRDDARRLYRALEPF